MVQGVDMVDRLQGPVDEGNVCRIWIKDEDGRTLIEVPMKLGLGPQQAVWAALGTLATARRRFIVEVQREDAWPDYQAPAPSGLTHPGAAVNEVANGEMAAPLHHENSAPISDSWGCGQQVVVDATGRSRCRDILPELIVELL